MTTGRIETQVRERAAQGVRAERAEDSIASRIETGRERLRQAQGVLAAYVEGLGIAETAAKLRKSNATIWRLRVWLGVQTIKPRGGRLDTRHAIEKAIP